MPTREHKVLVLSADLSELLILRRVVLETPFGVETARSIAQARDLAAHQRFVAAVVDASLPEGAAAALDELELAHPEVLRVLLGAPDSAPYPGCELVRRPYYAPALRTWLIELALRVVEFGQDDPTVKHPRVPKGDD
jgi:hypothetical protein